MPDVALADRRVAAPGAEWPKIVYATQRVKVSIVALCEFATAAHEAEAVVAIENARNLLATAGIKVETSYEQV